MVENKLVREKLTQFHKTIENLENIEVEIDDDDDMDIIMLSSLSISFKNINSFLYANEGIITLDKV